MKFSALEIDGACHITPEPAVDERGTFARLWCRAEFALHGIDVTVEQASLSTNRRAGTLRGMHYASAPSREGKLVRCQRGRAHDVLLDLRPDSATFLRHVGVELDAATAAAVWIPPGVAHGFLTLEDDTEIMYMMSEAYRPELAAGVRFDDPAFGIRWPRAVTSIAERDRNYPDFALPARRPSIAD